MQCNSDGSNVNKKYYTNRVYTMNIKQFLDKKDNILQEIIL
jgi:hypothetical protein